ncbi:CoA-transferase [Prauserella marina]|uniref:CoA-transferase n=1 Tax=Prauserella marina TaxID=530584 RepID=UPI000B87629E|nr:CoA-transferase [Prauserella marina]
MRSRPRTGRCPFDSGGTGDVVVLRDRQSEFGGHPGGGVTPVVHPSPEDLCRGHLRDGMRVHVASTMSRPNALVLAMARVFRGVATFEISSNAFHGNMHALTMAGIVRHAITCFAGDTYPSSQPNPLYSGLPGGDPFPVEEWSLLSLLQRLIAGATGSPFAVTTSLVGSDLNRNLPLVERGGRRAVLVPALRPDITLVHATCADRLGNLYLNGPGGEGWWGAMAARDGVLATVEKIVDTPPLEGRSIPADRVLGIAVRAFGAHPQGLPAWPECHFDGYQDDYEYLAELARSCRTAEERAAWVHDKLVAAPERHDGETGGSSTPAPSVVAAGAPSWREKHIVLAARAIVDRVLETGYGTILAGIGTAHVAAWLAAERLGAVGERVQVHAELGLIDMRPAAGDVFLFSQRHVARCRTYGDSLDVLGALVSGGSGKALAVLSAGEIDAEGRINSSRTADGGYFVGSGGANDFASHLETLVVAPASPRRLVPNVSFTTCPGDNVRTVVTQYGRLGRQDPSESFRLHTWLPPDDTPDADPVATMRSRTRWPVPDSRPEPEKPVTDDELAALRKLDPEGVYR